MADSKISALSSATTPMTGTEQVPIVQGGSTVKTTIQNMGCVLQSKTVLTNAQILTLHSVPVTLIAAPGAGLAIWPFGAYVTMNSAGGAYGAQNGSTDGITLAIGSSQLNAYLLNASPLTWNQMITSGEFASSYLTFPGNQIYSTNKLISASIDYNGGPFIVNQPLTVQAATNLTGGNAANTMTFIIPYIILVP